MMRLQILSSVWVAVRTDVAPIILWGQGMVIICACVRVCVCCKHTWVPVCEYTCIWLHVCIRAWPKVDVGSLP